MCGAMCCSLVLDLLSWMLFRSTATDFVVVYQLWNIVVGYIVAWEEYCQQESYFDRAQILPNARDGDSWVATG